MAARHFAAAAAAITTLMAAEQGAAHHSGALFYDAEHGAMTITGVVSSFSFRNPHAIVELVVAPGEDESGNGGGGERWVAETAAPSALRRRGWTQDSLSPGERVTLEGFRARDGSRLMRITRVTRADGTEVGVPRGLDE